MYLPRSTPPGQAQLDPIHNSLIGYENEDERFITVDIHNSDSARAALEKLQTSAQVLVAASYLCPTTDAVPLKADTAVTKDLHFWGIGAPHTHTVVFKTPFVASAPRQGQFLRYPSCQEI